MGLDLLVRIQSDFETDEFGRNTWTVTELTNLRKCHTILEQLSNRLDGGFSNCSTHSFYGKTFHEILEDMQEELTELTELSKVQELDNYQKNKIANLSCEIEMLENFIAANDVPNDDTECYEVYAWW